MGSKVARKSYKTLYLAEEVRARQEKARADLFKSQLDDINSALIPHGETVLHDIPTFTIGPREVILSPLDFVAALAFMDTLERLDRHLGHPDEGFTVYAWRGRPILRAKV